MTDLAEGCAATLETARLRLTPPTEADAPEIAHLVNEWEVVRFTAMIPYPYAPQMALEWIAKVSVEQALGTNRVYVVRRQSEDAVLGVVGLEIDADTATGSIGYWLGRPYWGRGYATEAAGRVLATAFGELGLKRVVADVVPENAASMAIMRKLGFRRVGEGRRWFRARGAELDVVEHEITRAEWAAANALPVLLVAAVALIDVDGRVLLARRPLGKPMAGLWEFPGGKVQPGETPEAALVRELREELAIDTRESCLAPLTFASHSYERFHLLMPLYACRVWRGTVTPLEGQELAWVRPIRMGDYAMPPADVPLVAALRDLL